MTKVLVLYYSSYGHVETMALAVAEGAREDGAEAVVKRVPELVPEGSPPSRLQDRRRAGRDRRRAGRLRRGHHRHADPLRQHGGADDEFPRSDRRAMVRGQARRQGRRCHLDRQPAWRPGDDDPVHPRGALHPWHGNRRSSLQLKGQMLMDEVTGGSPYGTSTIAGEGDRQPSANELEGAWFQGATWHASPPSSPPDRRRGLRRRATRRLPVEERRSAWSGQAWVTPGDRRLRNWRLTLTLAAGSETWRPEEEMRIGELASEAGVSVRVLRHYEAQGLAHSERKPNGYRDYPPLAVERVRRIRAPLSAASARGRSASSCPASAGGKASIPRRAPRASSGTSRS